MTLDPLVRIQQDSSNTSYPKPPDDSCYAEDYSKPSDDAVNEDSTVSSSNQYREAERSTPSHEAVYGASTYSNSTQYSEQELSYHYEKSYADGRDRTYPSSLPNARRRTETRGDDYGPYNSSGYYTGRAMKSRYGASSGTYSSTGQYSDVSAPMSKLGLDAESSSRENRSDASPAYAPSAGSDFKVVELRPDSKQTTFFGGICEDMGLYGNDGNSSKAASRWNSEGLANNCIFTSVAYCLYMDAKQLAEYLDVEFSPDIKGLAVGEMEWHLRKLPGLYVVGIPTKAYDNTQGYSHKSGLRFLQWWLDLYGGRPFAVGYQRKDGSGHCVVAERSNRSDRKYKYTCFQKDTKGIDMTKEVRESDLRFAIFVDPRTTTTRIEIFRETDGDREFEYVRMEKDGQYSYARTWAPSRS